MSHLARRWRGVILATLTTFAWHSATSGHAEETRPPFIAGFERFSSTTKPEQAESGLLLLGELNCTSCHRAEPGLSAHLLPKQAPVLDNVGNRVRPDALRSFLAAPHSVKPGTTMPDVFAGWNEAEKKDAIDALTHFLTSTGGLSHSRLSRNSIAAGKTLYGQIGCAVCHGPRDDKAGESAAVPLGPLTTKYTVPSLTAFLLDPLKVRPSGRMPGLRLKADEATQIANFLLKDMQSDSQPNLEYRYYETTGSPEKMPDFDALTPRKTGVSDGFDLSVADRKDNVALRYLGYFPVERTGRYTFILGSDDGSRLHVDGKLLVDNDEVHSIREKRASIRLEKGTHKVVVDFFNGSGESILEVEIQGPGLPRQPAAGFLTLKGESPIPAEAKTGTAPDPALVAKGRILFGRIGCASCHALKIDDRPIASETSAPPLAALPATSTRGCLSLTPAKSVPRFDLNDSQRAAITAALGSIATLSMRLPTPAETITRTFTALNCYACHERDRRGGVEPSKNELFATTQKEMGDEGRLPPHLYFVGAKLNEAYLKQILAEGAKDRPYMLTRMPRFGADNGHALITALTTVDRMAPGPVPTFAETPRKVKSDGRFLVGGMALGCIKCHTFKGSEAEGIQAIDMAQMTRRLRHDWFQRYVVDPPAFRPGTRMPTAWPDGKSMLPKVLGGETLKQVEAVWQYLSDGPSATEPYGLGREPIPLMAMDEPVIYRNFIAGGGPRAIGVGYPEKANLAFDANDLRIALIWQGGFMDASKHWSGRGEGFKAPMGDNVVTLPAGAPFASLSALNIPWPSQPSRELGYQFRGYRLDASRRPTFSYASGTTRVDDQPLPVAGKTAPGFDRTLTLTSETPADNLYLRVATGDSITAEAGGWFKVNGEWKVRIEATAAPIVRSSGGKAELLVPVKFVGKSATVVEHFEW